MKMEVLFSAWRSMENAESVRGLIHSRCPSSAEGVQRALVTVLSDLGASGLITFASDLPPDGYALPWQEGVSRVENADECVTFFSTAHAEQYVLRYHG
jgi:hypothetical protein